MGKTSYKWERLILLFLAQAKVQQEDILRLSSRRKSRMFNQALLVLALVSLWWWNWQLLIATAIGIGLMWLAYKIPPQKWYKFWRKAISSVTGHNRKFIFAVVSGSIGGAIAYMTTAIWTESENHWLATGSILQGFGTLIILILLGWQINRESSDRHDAKFEQLLGDLTANDALKRLIAIRQLANLVQKKVLEPEQKQQLIEYFYFMLAHPQEITIQEALLDGLAVLGISAHNCHQSSFLSRELTPIKLQNIKDLV